jgi:hypothetical protein
LIFIETKGFKTEVYNCKRKLFFRYMTTYKLHNNEKADREIYFFEPTNIKDIKDCILIIKKIIKDGHKKKP